MTTKETFCPIDSIVAMDCIQGMQSLRAGSVDLVFADPPFNIGYDYDVYQDTKSYSGYLEWTHKWMYAAFRVLAANGSFWVAIGDEYAAEFKITALKAGFSARSWVVWYYTFGVNCTNKFTRSKCHLLYFTKDDKNFTFRADDMLNRVPSARQLEYNDKRANPKGRLPDDLWMLRPKDVPDGFSQEGDVWHFPRVAGTFKERAGFHGCQMPEALLQRIIGMCSNPGDLVLDPFCGSGTTAVAAKRLCRRFLSFDISVDYVSKALDRVAHVDVDPKYIPEDGEIKITLSTDEWKAVAAHCKWYTESRAPAEGKPFAGAVAGFLGEMLEAAEKAKNGWPSIQKDKGKLMMLVSLLTHEVARQSAPAAHAAGWRIANQIAITSPQQKSHVAKLNDQHPIEPEQLVTEEPADEQVSSTQTA